MTEEFKLPEDIVQVEKQAPPRDLVIIGQPKIGKGTILGEFTKKYNALILDLEKGGYEYIPARKISTYESQNTTRWESYQNYLKIRKLLLENSGKYDYLIIDGLSDLDDLSEIGGTIAYQKSILGKKFNRPNSDPSKEPYLPTDPLWKSVLTLPDGAGL